MIFLQVFELPSFIFLNILQFSFSVLSDSLRTPWTDVGQASLFITNCQLAQTHVHRVSDPSNHLILCHPLFLLPSIFPSIRVFPNESVLCIRCPRYWSFCFSISSSNEYSGLISRIDWLDLLLVQGALKSFIKHHSSKISILGAQLSL